MSSTNVKGYQKFLGALILISFFFTFCLLCLFSLRNKIPPIFNFGEPNHRNSALLLDTRTFNSSDLIEQGGKLARNVPLPLSYIMGKDKNGPRFYGNPSCARFPKLWDIAFHNTYWQLEATQYCRSSLHLYSAFLDVRKLSRIGPAIRILLSTNCVLQKANFTPTFYCQIWFHDESAPIISNVSHYQIISYVPTDPYTNGAIFRPYLLTCTLPNSHMNKVPASVSLVDGNYCKAATNNIRVQYYPLKENEKQKGFAVCVRGVNFPWDDRSHKFVEWIEMVQILGGHKIFMYTYNLHPNSSKVLKYYEDKGVVDLTPLTLPGAQPNEPFIRSVYYAEHGNDQIFANDKVDYNDCLYRNMYKYEYVTMIDVDELMMPLKKGGFTWRDLMTTLRAETSNLTVSFVFRNFKFADDPPKKDPAFDAFPRHLQMLTKTVGWYAPVGHGIKCMHRTDLTVAAHNHFGKAYLVDGAVHANVDTKIGHLQHYRQYFHCTDREVIDAKQNCIVETNMWRYKKDLIKRTNRVFNELNFFSNK